MEEVIAPGQRRAEDAAMHSEGPTDYETTFGDEPTQTGVNY
jgi:hypothetical protein